MDATCRKRPATARTSVLALLLCTLPLACVEIRISEVSLTQVSADDFSLRLALDVGLDDATERMIDDPEMRTAVETASAIESLPVYLAVRGPRDMRITGVSVTTTGSLLGGEPAVTAGLAPQLGRWFEQEMPAPNGERWTVFHAMLSDVGPASERALDLEVSLGDVPAGESRIRVSPGYFGGRWEHFEPTPPAEIRIVRDRAGATARLENRHPATEEGARP